MSYSSLQKKLHRVIFEADTSIGKVFDIGLFCIILLSVAAVLLESVASVRENYAVSLLAAEWGFTLLFSVEYLLRLYCVGRPLRYALSFYGLIDLLAILPSLLSLLIPGIQSLLVIRVLRLLRVFRVLKLPRFVRESGQLKTALVASVRKIAIFTSTVLLLVVIIGALMYLVEGVENGFTSIPVSIYWAIVTLTTVGYGDIAPQTSAGKLLASAVMILGYGVIAVPTGIVTVELSRAMPPPASTKTCSECAAEGHDDDARYCKYCAAELS